MSDAQGQNPQAQSQSTGDQSKADQFKQQARQVVDNLKTELSARLDQLLDELGAMI